MYTSSLWAIRHTPVHYGQLGVHQCTVGNQVYTGALWAIRCTPVHYRQSGVQQCTMGYQVYTSALWAIRWRPVHHGQASGMQPDFFFHSLKILKIPSKLRLNLQNLEANLQIRLILFKLACSYISLYAVQLACMQFFQLS